MLRSLSFKRFLCPSLISRVKGWLRSFCLPVLSLSRSPRGGHLEWMAACCDPFFDYCERSVWLIGMFCFILVIFGISLVVFTFYTYMVPFLYKTESGPIFTFYFIYGHYLLINITFHYFKGVYTDPGKSIKGSGVKLTDLQIKSGWKTCYKCDARKPPRAHHCRICGKCVFKMDHHCPWMFNCIGQYNHRHFMLFIIFMWLGVCYVVHCCWTRVIAGMQLDTILTLLFQNLMLLISLVFVGHISDRSLELDSAALSNSFANITGISVGIGLSSAADTLCSQSFGYKNYKRVGHIFQRGVVILLLLSLFVWVIWLNTDSIMLLVQQSPCVAKFSGTYMQIFTLALPPLFVYWMLQKYFQAQSIVWPFIFTGFLTNVACVIFHAIFVIWADLGVNGASLSLVLSYYTFPLFVIIYIRWRKLYTKTWDGWSWESLKVWNQFLKLGLPGLAMTCLEWISYEVAAFVLGSISEVELAVNSIMVNAIIMLFMIPLGVSIAAGVRIGNELGAGNPLKAKRSSYIAMAVVFTNTVIQVIFLQATKSYFGFMYTQDSEVLARLPKLIDVISVLIFADQLQLSLRGVVLGCGQQLFASIVNFIAFYIIGLPIGISLALLTDLGSVGMWTGMTIAAYFQLSCLLVFLCRLNWKKESDKAILRSKDEEERKLEDEEKGSVSDEVQLVGIARESKDELEGTELQKCTQDNSMEGEEEEEEREKEREDEESLLSHDSQEELVTESNERTSSKGLAYSSYNKRSQHIRLLLTKGSLFLFGAVLVVIAGIVSMFHPPESIINGNYSECTVEVLGPFDSEPIESSIVFIIAPTPSVA